MHEFRVWAPTAAPVDAGRRRPATTGAGRWPAEPTAGGRPTVAEAGHGTDYAFSVDGGDPLPDPRSAWQPHGVHGLSRVFDAGRVQLDGRRLGRAGTCSARCSTSCTSARSPRRARSTRPIERLDHLVELGVDVVSS